MGIAPPPDASDANPEPREPVVQVDVYTYDVVVLTQTCDLSDGGARHVVFCPTFDEKTFLEANPDFARAGKMGHVKAQRVIGLYWLVSPPAFHDPALIVDFRDVITLPREFLASHAQALGARWRLQSPYREHLSRAFGDYFSRVALP